MMNRILLALGDGADTYYDYYTLGRPTLALSTAVADDRPPEPEEEPATAPPLSKL